MAFLQLIESIASNINAQNIDEFISLTENLISLGESVFKNQAVAPAVASPAVSASPASQQAS
jgi:hypothetical protein